jgi:phosphohistidine swiveling domain-containing protein
VAGAEAVGTQPRKTRRVNNVDLTHATIAKLDLHEGDVLVVRATDKLVKRELAKEIAEALKAAGITNHVLLLGESLSLEILARDAA